VALLIVDKNGMPDVVMHIYNPCSLGGRGSMNKVLGWWGKKHETLSEK
jgi:hypothetical protein